MKIDLSVIAIVFGIIVSVILILVLLLKKEEILADFIERRRLIKKGKSDENAANNSLEVQLNSMLSKVESYVETSQKMAVANNTAVSSRAKLAKSILGTIKSPYNSLSVVRMFFILVICATVGLCSGMLTKNPAAMISLFALSILTPFSFISLSCMRKKQQKSVSNLHLISVFLPNYLDSGSFEEALVRTKKNLSSSSEEGKVVDATLHAMLEYNMDIDAAIDDLTRRMGYGKYEVNCMETIRKAETIHTQYKRSVSPIVSCFSELVISNTQLVNYSFFLFIVYMIGIVVLIAVMIILRNGDQVAYAKLLTIKGQAILFVLFSLVCASGIGIARTADIIDLDLYVPKNTEDDMEAN